jgi:Flp pilus assembly protein TadD
VSRNPYILAKRSKQRRTAANFVDRVSDSTPAQPPARTSLFVENLLANGLAHHQAGRLGEAEREYRKILNLDPRHANSLHLLGMVAFQAGHLDAAASLIRRAIANQGNTTIYHANLGNVLHTQGKLEEAVECYRRALQLNPASAVAHANLGLTLQFLGRLEEAAASFEHALELSPEIAVVHSNLGNVRQAQGRLEDAALCHARALEVEPANSEAYSNLGTVLDLQGRLQESAASYDRALALKPEFAVARFSRSLLRLLQGDFINGLPDYEDRRFLHKPRGFTKPQWRGEPLNHARILLHAEQGLGDTLQFLRYVPMVQAAGGEVVLEVQAAIRRLAAQLPGIEPEDIFASGESLPEFDWHCPLMSLPLAFGTTLDSIPGQVPYLTVPFEAAEKASHFTWPDKGLRVGLAWAGSATHLKDRYRSIPLALLEPQLATEGVRFFSLQVGPAAAQLAATIESAGGGPATDLEPEIEDMADTAALIANLDLVIAVDTAVVHLAGALAKPVWVLLPVSPDWRWLLGRADSPWYPTMRLFRQTELGDWPPVIEAVRRALVEEIEKGSDA